jgi:hypothetical protein
MLNIPDSGYLVIPNALTSLQLQIAKDSIKVNGLVDYTQLKQFIDQIYFNKLNSVLGWKSIYHKFRFSSSAHSNLKDAGSFHGDVYNLSKEETMPIYTGLCYLDHAVLEIIPGTHKGVVSPDAYKTRIQININPGDILIFHANLHHRGIPGSNDRRLIQIFDIFPNELIANKYQSKLYSVLTYQCWPIKSFHANTKSYQVLEKSNTKSSFGLLDKIHYWLVIKNLQYSIIGLDIPYKSKIGNFVGYESGPRDVIKPNQLQPLNINMIVRPHNTYIPSCTKINLAIVLILLLVLWTGYKFFKFSKFVKK